MEQQYKIEKCNSKVGLINPSDNLMDYFKRFSKAKAIVWYEDRIIFYNIVKSEWNEEIGNINEIVRFRLFDEEKELHLWRSNGILKGRIRIDSTGDDTEFVTANPILNGSNFTQPKNENYLIAWEDKGTRFQLPYLEEFQALIENKENRLALVTRNYIDYSPVGQSGYIDSRFVNLKII